VVQKFVPGSEQVIANFLTSMIQMRFNLHGVFNKYVNKVHISEVKTFFPLEWDHTAAEC
jgi:hypothetical protein